MQNFHRGLLSRYVASHRELAWGWMHHYWCREGDRKGDSCWGWMEDQEGQPLTDSTVTRNSTSISIGEGSTTTGLASVRMALRKEEKKSRHDSSSIPIFSRCVSHPTVNAMRINHTQNTTKWKVQVPSRTGCHS